MPDSNITKRALAQTMKELMVERPFAKVSVGDICEACGMNRKSFYYHFKDKHDLVNWIFYTEFIERVHLTEYTSAWGLLEDICAYFYQYKEFYRNALLIEGQNSFRDYFTDTIRPFLTALNQDLLQETVDPDFYVAFFADAFMSAILRWLMEPTPLAPELFSQQLESVLVGFARKTLSDFGESTELPTQSRQKCPVS